jgi:hypothetical protein
MTTAIDPTRVLSFNMLLSDFVGCHSVYYYGYPNPVQSDQWFRGSPVTTNWRTLTHFLSRAATRMGPTAISAQAYSISYGWIHPRLSEKIVRWKKPTDSSYHRWDAGAACDINFHGVTYVPYHFNSATDSDPESWGALSPLGIATVINTASSLPHVLDRTITYSESPYVCVGVSNREAVGTKKWYENRFTGVPREKPQFLTYKSGRDGCAREPRPLETDWRGQGWPSYHGKGVRQYQHIRTSYYTVMSDWLYDRDNVHFGVANRMPMSTPRYDTLKHAMHLAGRVYDVAQSLAHGHVSIIEGLKMGKRTSNWEEQGYWSMTLTVPPERATQFVDDIRGHIASNEGRPELGVRAVSPRTPRNYLTDIGGRTSRMQYRVKITGEMYVHGDEQFDFDSPARSPAYREAAERDSGGGDSGPGGVVDPPRRTRSRRNSGNSRRGVVAGTFD